MNDKINNYKSNAPINNALNDITVNCVTGITFVYNILLQLSLQGDENDMNLNFCCS